MDGGEQKQDRSVPSISRVGTGTVLGVVVSSQLARCQPAGVAADPAGFFQRLQDLAQTLVLDGERVAKLGARQHRAVGPAGQHLVRPESLAGLARERSATTSRCVVSAGLATSSSVHRR